MIALDAPLVVLTVLVIGGSVAVIVFAAAVLVRSRRAGNATFSGRPIHRPRLWASAAVCCGLAGLLFLARELMPSSWQKPSLYILAVLQLAFFGLLFTHIFSLLLAKRRQHR